MAVEILSAIGESLRMAFFMFWDTLWPLVFGFGVSGAVQAFVSRSGMQRVLGDHRPRTLAVAAVFGAASSSCSYAASAMARSLFQKGADFTTAMVFMLASTNLVVELGLVLWILIGWQFAVSEYVGGIIMIGLLALIARFAFRPRLIAAARTRLDQTSAASPHGDHGDGSGEASPSVPWTKRLRSAGGWADAAGYTLADLTMLRREMLVGYLVAGFTAVLVPAAVWNDVFFRGHGFATSVENVLVGPVIAILSFVCSIGNVPLAAALWKGGISFGGVISFIFADLITFPLILIYRKLYGWRLTLRIVGGFWLVMAAAGLATEYIFAAAGLVPATHPAEVVQPSFQWNYTTFLNIAFLGVFAGLYWLHRNRERFGGGAGYATDPVCGMQVQVGLAPASAVHGGRTHHFCSDRCRDRFTGDPEGYATRGPEGMADRTGASATDPVCGMAVDPSAAAATVEHGGRTHHFCSQGCARSFAEDPGRYPAARQERVM
ncbi:MAG: permease [Candidatus Dormibacteraceae bacterium]